MHILINLTYYRPHFSGLTIYAERLARTLVKLGHKVTVLTSRFRPDLPEQEMVDGVHVIRPFVAMRISKGVIMPTLPFWALKLMREVDVVNLHLPQMDAAYISWIARLYGKPVVTTYHCDLLLPTGAIHWVANQGAHLFSHLTAAASDVIVTNSHDYAENSWFLRKNMDKLRIITPPVEVAQVSENDIAKFCAKYQIQNGQIIIGMVARLACEKGVEYLIGAMPKVIEKYPTARVMYVGQYKNVLGEEQYAEMLAPMIEKLGEHWTFLGLLPAEELAAFFHVARVIVSPSLNSTESFGMVQVEAMTCGTPAVSSNIPGVRCPVKETGMGRIVPPGDSQAIAEAIIEILDHPASVQGDADAVRRRYSPESVARKYEAIFKELTSSK